MPGRMYTTLLLSCALLMSMVASAKGQSFPSPLRVAPASAPAGGSEVAQLTVQVVAVGQALAPGGHIELSPDLTRSNGRVSIALGPGESGETANIPVATYIFLHGAGGENVSFTPAQGVLARPVGRRAPNGDIALLQAVGPGTAKITWTGQPEATEGCGDIAPFGWCSGNWSGYAGTGSFGDIAGSWTVPHLSSTCGAACGSASSTWIGIDGFGNQNLIQTGTEQDYRSGQPDYAAWWRSCRRPRRVIDYTVMPGDRMHAEIRSLGGGTWLIELQDTTEGWTFMLDKRYAGQQSSVEWITEAPTYGQIVALADYGQTEFDDGTANGSSPGFVAADGGVMIQDGVHVSTPSMPDADADGFAVAYGAASPPAPVILAVYLPLLTQ